MGPNEETFYEETFREEPVIEAAIVEVYAATVVVEGPGDDAKFLSKWVAAAVKVQAAWDVAGKGPDGDLYEDVMLWRRLHPTSDCGPSISLHAYEGASAASPPFCLFPSTSSQTTLRSCWGWGSLKPPRITTAWWSRTIFRRPRSKLL